MKKFVQKMLDFGRRARLALFVALGVTAGSAFAQESAPTITPTSYTVPGSVTSAVNDLAGAADGYAAVLLPYIAYIGLAFIGITIVYLLFKVFRKFVGGGR